MYAKGRGVAQDDVQAVKWFRKAALQGNASAQYNLGLMYYKGESVTQDYVLGTCGGISPHPARQANKIRRIQRLVI